MKTEAIKKQNPGKNKILLIIGIIILLGGIPATIFLINQSTGLSLRAKDENEPQNVRTLQITGQSATISWTTEEAVQGVISYGLSANNLTLVQPETAPAVNHQVILKRLLPGRDYFFVIKTDEETFYDQANTPFKFTTQAAQAAQATSTPVPALTEKSLKAVMGTSNPTYDLNQDGTVNTLDLFLFREQNK